MEFALDGIYHVKSVSQDEDGAMVTLTNGLSGRTTTIRPDSLFASNGEDSVDSLLKFVADRTTVEVVIREVAG